jgi:hypothetical protein
MIYTPVAHQFCLFRGKEKFGRFVASTLLTWFLSATFLPRATMQTPTHTAAASICNASLVNVHQGFSNASNSWDVTVRRVGHAVSMIQNFISPYVMHLKTSPSKDLWHAVNSRILKNSVSFIILICKEQFSKTRWHKKHITLNGMGRSIPVSFWDPDSSRRM